MRHLRFLLPFLAFPLLLCRLPNRAPELDWLRGHTAVVPGSTYAFLVVGLDPDGDSLQCELDWGDGTPCALSDWQPSRDTFSFSHSWADTGDYRVGFRLRDSHEALSSPGQFALVRCRPAIAPAPPEVDSTWGPARGYAGVRYYFGARAQDANADRLRFQFDWGDGEFTEWSPWMRSGSDSRRYHSWSTTGAFVVLVRCEDRGGLVTDWVPVAEVAVVAEPALRWEVALDEPSARVPLAAQEGEVAVADREMVARYSREDGHWLGEHLGPGSVLALAGRAADGVFVRDRDGFWGFVPGRRWQSSVEGVTLAPMVVAGRVFAPTRDTTWFLAAATGSRTGSVNALALNWISPAVDESKQLVCVGDSLRRFKADGAPAGTWRAPALVPEEFIVGPGRYYGCGRLDPDRTMLQCFDTAGTRWFRLLGGVPSPRSPLTPVTGPDGRVFFACRDSVCAFSPSGGLLWSWRPGAGAVSCGTPCLGSEGDLLVGVAGTDGGALVALDSLGGERWRITLDCGAVLGMVLAADSVVYGIGADDATLFAAWVAQGPAGGWPMYRHDAGLSGSAAP